MGVSLIHLLKLAVAATLCQAAAGFAPGVRSARTLRTGAVAQSSLRRSGTALVSMQSDAAAEAEGSAVPFEVRGFSYSSVVLGAAFTITFYSFFQFFINDGEASSSLGFVYGIPGMLLGSALKYAEVPPVPVESSPAADAARESLANANLKKIYSDVTRFRYADLHLEDALKALGLQPRGDGPPELLKVNESVLADASYSMELTFASKATPYNSWMRNAHRYANFFGPNVRAIMTKVDADKRIVSLSLVTVKPGESLQPMEKQPDGSFLPISLDGTVEGRAE
jgi:hypothetical protein